MVTAATTIDRDGSVPATQTGPWHARIRQRFFRRAPTDREPVVLRHSRIYILPTRRGLAIIATLTVMLLTSLNYALSLGFVATFLVAGLVAAALLHTFRNLAGIEVKPLATDLERHRVSMLVRLAAGASYPAHTHAGIEELHLLDGELWIDDRKLVPGDYNHGAPGTGDDRVWSETGCTCVLITSTQDILR